MLSRKKAEGLPVDTLVIIIIVVLVLVITLIFWQVATGQHIFPDLLNKIKEIFGAWKATNVTQP